MKVLCLKSGLSFVEFVKWNCIFVGIIYWDIWKVFFVVGGVDNLCVNYGFLLVVDFFGGF